MKRLLCNALLVLAFVGPAVAAERAIDKSIDAPASLDQAWGNVLANLKKRFEQGPQDWTAWLEALRRQRQAAAASAPAR